MKQADLIAYHLQKWVKSSGYDIIIPNFYYGTYEMDLFKLTASELVTEYEIKISRADFFNDFRKQRYGDNKHNLFSQGKGDCNRFYFVTPKGLIRPEEVPKYAGLIYHTGNWYFEIAKNAPLIHKDKNRVDKDLYRYICKRLAFRELMHKGKYRHEKYLHEQLAKHVIENNINLPIWLHALLPKMKESPNTLNKDDL